MPAATIRFCDETESRLRVDRLAAELLQRASARARSDGRVWLVDPVDGPGLEERVRPSASPPASSSSSTGTTATAPRSRRASASRTTGFPSRGVPGSPFEVRTVLSLPGWREAALWWEAERVLVCMEALGTSRYFRGPDEELAVHPFLRLHQPRGLRDLARRLAPGHVLVGHGEGIHDGAAPALVRAVDTARRGTPRWLRHQLRRRRTP